VQGNPLNRSCVATVICVPLISNLRWADAPGDVLWRARSTGLPKDSVANMSQIVAIDRTLLSRHVGRLSERQLDLVFAGIDIVFDR
jgi:mRNA interferase MazF